MVKVGSVREAGLARAARCFAPLWPVEGSLTLLLLMTNVYLMTPHSQHHICHISDMSDWMHVEFKKEN